jgi:hypothetical protein
MKPRSGSLPGVADFFPFIGFSGPKSYSSSVAVKAFTCLSGEIIGVLRKSGTGF